MATYVNNLRLKEIATGAESGTWGTSTNTNLELIADALGSGTEAITTNADTHTTTIADGAADEGRALFLKYTGTLDSACTITLAPNTVNKMWFIENATSGSQNIIISQGSGANITIASGKIAVIYTDGAGSGAAVLDALADLELSSTLSVAGATTLTGVTTHGGNVVSDTDSTDDLGTTGVRWANLYVDDVVATTTVKPGTLVLAAGSITDTSGAITFGNENLVTTGTLGSGALTASTIAGTDITASGDVIIGTNPASSGDIRLNKDFQVYTRNNANDANKVVMGENVVTGNDTLDIGDNTKWAAIRFHVSVANVMELTQTAINLNKAVTASSTLAVTGDATVTADVILGTNNTSKLIGINTSGAETDLVYLDNANDVSLGGGGNSVTMAGDLKLAATKKLYLDGGGDTYIIETGTNAVDVFTGGTARLRIENGHIAIPATNKFYLDGGGNTYIVEESADDLHFVTGGTARLTIAADGKTHVNGGTAAAYPAAGFATFWTTADQYAANFRHDGNATTSVGISIICGADDAAGTNTAVSILSGNGTTQGTITFTSGTVSYNAFTAGHDASLPVGETAYAYGTLVEIVEIYYKQEDGQDMERGILYKVQKSQSAYAKNVLGAYSGQYTESVVDDENLHQIYCLGDGHIICNGENGDIEVGDGICTSSTEGEGMKADQLSMIIGMAQEDTSFSSASETKLVPVQYGLKQFQPWS